MLKKRQSRRISSRKKHNIEKRIKNRSKKLFKLKKKESKGYSKLPKTVLLTDEELENLKKIKEEEHKRKDVENIQTLDNFNFIKLVENSDLLLEVLDARDPLGSLSLKHEKYIKEKEKNLVLCINNKDGVPLKIVEYWKGILKELGYKVSDSISIKDDLLSNNLKIKVGIYGQKGVGKMYLLKSLNSPLVSKSLFQTPPTQYDLLTLLRNVIPLKSVFPKKILIDLLNYINRDEFSLYFGISYFNTLKELENEFMKKFRLTPLGIDEKVFNLILNEMHKGNIKFYRKDVEGCIEFDY